MIDRPLIDISTERVPSVEPGLCSAGQGTWCRDSSKYKSTRVTRLKRLARLNLFLLTLNLQSLTTMARLHLPPEPLAPLGPTFHRYISRSSYDSFWRRSWVVAIAIFFLMVLSDQIGHPGWGVAIAAVFGFLLTAVLMAEVLGC